MRILNEKTNESYAVAVHGKKPAYFDESQRRKEVTINGKKQDMVLHKSREDSVRVNFAGANGTYYFVDNEALRDLIASTSKAELKFVTQVKVKKAKAPEVEAKPEVKAK